MTFVLGPWVSFGVHVNTPVKRSTAAPEGALLMVKKREPGRKFRSATELVNLSVFSSFTLKWIGTVVERFVVIETEAEAKLLLRVNSLVVVDTLAVFIRVPGDCLLYTS